MAEERTVRLRSRLLLKELLDTANEGEGFSYRQMADRCSCGKTIIGNLVTGVDETCTESLGERIAEVVGVHPRVLFVPDESVRRGRRPRTPASDAVAS